MDHLLVGSNFFWLGRCFFDKVFVFGIIAPINPQNMDNSLPIPPQNNGVPAQDTIPAASPTMKLYSPSQYLFMGFLLSLVPVFIMSFSNSKLIPNGEMLRKRIKTYLIIFIILILSYVSVLAWASITVAKSLTTAVLDNPSAAVNLSIANDLNMPTDDIIGGLIPKEAENAKKILDNASAIYFVLNTLLLIVVVMYTKKNELNVVKDLQEKKLAGIKNMAVPALAGIVFVLAVLFGSGPLLTMITKMVVSPSQYTLNIPENEPKTAVPQPKISATVNTKADDGASMQSSIKTDSSCDLLPAKLDSCTPYKCQFSHPISGEMLTKEINGLAEGKCNYIEQLPGNGRMECNFPEDVRRSVAQYYEEVAYAESTGTAVKKYFTEDGQELLTPEQKALVDNQCDILGY